MPPIELSPDELQTLISYAERKYERERWPLSRELQPVREVLEKVAPRRPLPLPVPLPPKVVAEPTIAVQRAKSRRQRAAGLYGQF